MSRALGEKDPAHASRIAVSGMVLEAGSYVLFLIIGLFFTETFMRAQISAEVPAEDAAEIIAHGVSYLRIVLIFSFGVFAEITYERILQSTGRTTLSMITQLIGAILNIIFDPILIFGYLGFPAMGVAGAAVATVGGQAVSMLLGFFFLFRRGNLVSVRLKGFRPERRIIADIYRVGLPSIVMQAIGSVTTFALNNILYLFTPTAVSVLGVYFKLQSFVFMPVFGLNSGAMPIMGYNFGARNKKRLMQALKCGVLYALAIMMVGLLVFQIFPDVLLELFDASENMMQIGMIALRTISFCFPFAAVGIMLSTLFQAVGQGVNSMIMSLCRQIIVLIPVAYLLAMEWGLNAVWYAFLIAEAASLVVCAVLLRRTYARYIKPLDEKTEAAA